VFFRIAQGIGYSAAQEFIHLGAEVFINSRNQTEVDEEGPGGYCSPRHRGPFNSRNKGADCVSMTRRAPGLADVARHIIGI
jgi:NAD(P)-dependent dehydrogenase (short-subunit alcohol dehydrogenase family)